MSTRKSSIFYGCLIGLSCLVVGMVLEFTHRDWQLAFLISSVIYFLGAFCWLFIDPVTPLENQAKA